MLGFRGSRSGDTAPNPLRSNTRKLSNLSATNAPVTELPNGYSIDIPPSYEARRGQLLEPLYGCDSALAIELIVDSKGNQTLGKPFIVTDPLSKVDEVTMLAGQLDDEGFWYLPIGTCFDCHYRTDSSSWEFDTPGSCCLGSGSEGSGSEGSGPGAQCAEVVWSHDGTTICSGRLQPVAQVSGHDAWSGDIDDCLDPGVGGGPYTISFDPVQMTWVLTDGTLTWKNHGGPAGTYQAVTGDYKAHVTLADCPGSEGSGSEGSEGSEGSGSTPCYPVPHWLRNVPMSDSMPSWLVGADANNCLNRFTTEACGSGGGGGGSGNFNGGTP